MRPAVVVFLQVRQQRFGHAGMGPEIADDFRDRCKLSTKFGCTTKENEGGAELPQPLWLRKFDQSPNQPGEQRQPEHKKDETVAREPNRLPLGEVSEQKETENG